MRRPTLKRFYAFTRMQEPLRPSPPAASSTVSTFVGHRHREVTRLRRPGRIHVGPVGVDHSVWLAGGPRGPGAVPADDDRSADVAMKAWSTSSRRWAQVRTERDAELVVIGSREATALVTRTIDRLGLQ